VPHTPRAILAIAPYHRDPAAAAGFGRQLQEWPAWVHLALACIALLFNAPPFFILQYDRIRANGQMIDESDGDGGGNAGEARTAEQSGSVCGRDDEAVTGGGGTVMEWP